MILSALLQKKKATIPPKSYRADRFNQGFTALATKVTPLWVFGYSLGIRVGRPHKVLLSFKVLDGTLGY
ncbi:hypothetical protein CA2015_0768 [Cyclobacterium amurskyense]|uniref:Uncharacterized protein n=1 Tax=Cyclobacterium amurskyense TaxID=320787 RepID=A0A0H4PBP6_9BACT|nr:hypothetical protein CA2015_0768 [Cyclobacterium amurskyense]